MRVLVTGAHGKVGSHAVTALLAAGHEVTATDLHPPEHERDAPGAAGYVRADLTDAGAAYALVDGHDAVVHAAAIPDPLHDPPLHVFRTNVTAAMHVVDACVRTGVDRLVNVSSETVPGFVFAPEHVDPAYLPVDEDVPPYAHDEYGYGKEVVERWCDRVATRDGLSTITVRPSWVMHADNVERNLGPLVREPFQPSGNFWSWTDAQDLATALRLACEVEHDGHSVVYVAQPDNGTGVPLVELVERVYPHLLDRVRAHDLTRPDAGGIDSSRAEELLGWSATRTLDDWLDAEGRRHTD